MPSSTIEARERMLHAILARASTDLSFRLGLLAEPRKTISDALGVTIPPSFRIRFIEKEPDLDALVVLPDLRSTGDELSERDLEAANGGQGLGLNWADLGDFPW